MNYDIAGLAAELGAAGIATIADAGRLRNKSRDFYWYSPILKAQLDGKRADLWLRPKNEAEVLRILAAARAQGG